MDSDSSELKPPPLAVGPGHRLTAFGTVTVLLLAALVLTPLADMPLPALPGFLSAYAATMIVSNLLLAALLYGRGATEQRAGTLQLGSAYLFVGLIFVPLLLSFPNSLVGGSLIGSPASSLWLWTMWHAGFGLGVARYAWTLWRGGTPGRVAHEVLATVLVVALLALLATASLELLPTLLADGRTLFGARQQTIPWVILAVDLIALAALLRRRQPGVEQTWLCVAMVAASVDVWLTYQGGARFSLGWYASKLCSLATSLTVLVSLFHELNQLYRRASRANAVLAGLAHQDGLTGVANRRHFDEVLAIEWARSFRAQRPMALLMIDVDLFKQFNDHHGHAAGDQCLRRVAQLTRACTRRAGDLTARYGGEEFAVILPDTDIAGASVMAALLRRELAAMAIPHAGSPNGVLTLSIGIALTQPRQTSPADLLQAADAALYQAKREGRDRACLAPQAGVSESPPDWGTESQGLAAAP